MKLKRLRIKISDIGKLVSWHLFGNSPQNPSFGDLDGFPPSLPWVTRGGKAVVSSRTFILTTTDN
ncbi:hypothetical protein MSG28_002800, partial [Choristoneura fumiferana]